MPDRSVRFCRAPGCPNKQVEPYCATHKKNSTHAQGRPFWDAWYSSAHWKRIKAAFLAACPERAAFCQWVENGVACHRLAVVVDHVQPHKGNWNLFCGGVGYENLQGLCARHHSMKTASEGGFGNG